MIITLSWLNRHLEHSASLDTIIEQLNNLGLEVEEFTNINNLSDNIVCGLITNVSKHPNADKLQLLKVNIGNSQDIDIVCGANNVKVGLKTAIALPGAMIPLHNFKIKVSKIRNCQSNGMACSAKELMIGDDDSGIMELDNMIDPGTAIKNIIDPSIKLSITPNRADCLGVRGIARDLAASGIGKLKPLNVPKITPLNHNKITIKSQLKSDICSHFAGRYISNISNNETPLWMKQLLRAVNIKPICAIIDIINFITIDLCRPANIFNADTINDDINLCISNNKQTMLGRNGKNYQLNNNDIIATSNNKVIALLGITEGQEAGLSEIINNNSNKNILLTTALLNSVNIHKTAKRIKISNDHDLGINIESKHRYERFLDNNFVKTGLDIITSYILDICGGEPSEITEIGKAQPYGKKLNLTPEYFEKISSLSLSKVKIDNYLLALGIEKSHNQYLIPAWRSDLTHSRNLVEEIIRLHNWNTLAEQGIIAEQQPLSLTTKYCRQIARNLAAHGLHEAVTWSFVTKADALKFNDNIIKIINPISQELSVMRNSLLTNLINIAKNNYYNGNQDIAMFEIGNTFHGYKPWQQQLIIAGIRSNNYNQRNIHSKVRPVDLFDIKADLMSALHVLNINDTDITINNTELPYYANNKAGAIIFKQQTIATFGAINPKILKNMQIKFPVVAFELYFDKIAKQKTFQQHDKQLFNYCKLPKVIRDFSFIIDKKISGQEIIKTISKSNNYISKADIFDLYKMDDNNLSIGLTVTFLPTNKTFSGQEITDMYNSIITTIISKLNGKMRD